MSINRRENDTYQKTYTLKNDRTLIVREPNVKDAQDMVTYMKAVDCETRFLAREPGEFGFTVEQEEAYIGKLAQDKNTRLLLATIDGEIVAICSVGIVTNNRRFLHRAGLGISVKQAYWGRGIGRILMNECILWCRNKNVEQVELDVVTDNKRAIAMYKSLGFEIHGTKKHAMKYGDGTYADEHFMMLSLEKN